MSIRTYARIQDGIVAEVLKTNADIATMYSPMLVWVDVTTQVGIRDGWRFDGKTFSPPAALTSNVSAPTIAELRAQLAALGAKIAALSDHK